MHYRGQTTDKGPSASPPLNEDYLSTYKRRKITHACDYCRIKRTKCDSVKPQCSQCLKANVACTFLIRHKKRGPIPRDPYELRRMSDGDLVQDHGQIHRPAVTAQSRDRSPIEHPSVAALDQIGKAQTTWTSRLESMLEPSPLETASVSPPLRQYSIQVDTPCKEVSDHLIEMFFLHCYQDFEFLDPQAFLDEYSRGMASPILLNAMFAVAARFSDHPQVARTPQYLSGEPFAKYVRGRIMELIDEASLDHFHALLLMSFFEYTTSRGARGWRFEGLACRMSLELLLHLQTSIPRSEADRVALEVKYRSFYSVLLSDIISAANAGMPPVLVSKHYKFNIPEPAIDWWVYQQPDHRPERDTSDREEVEEGKVNSPTLQDYNREGILHRLREPRRFRGYGPAQYVFKLAEILSRVSGYINGYTLDSDKRPNDPDSEFSILNDDLSSWLESIPHDLSPSCSPDKVFSVNSNSTFMALTYYMTVVLLHRPILALEELIDEPFFHRSFTKCTDVATKASQIIHQFDADTIKYRGHTFAFAVFTTATIHVTNAFSTNEELARSAKQCLNYHLTFMKEANPYCAMAGRFYYVIQDLYSMQGKLHATVTPPVSRKERHVEAIELVSEGHVAVDQDREMDFVAESIHTPDPPCRVSPMSNSSVSPSISSTSTTSGRSRVLPVSSLLKSDSGLVGLWKRVDEMQALDTAAHSLRQLSLRSPQISPPISTRALHEATPVATPVVSPIASPTLEESVEFRGGLDVRTPGEGPAMPEIITSEVTDRDNVEGITFNTFAGVTSLPTLNDSSEVFEMTERQTADRKYTLSSINLTMGERLLPTETPPQENLDKQNILLGRPCASQGRTHDGIQRNDSNTVNQSRITGSTMSNSMVVVESRVTNGADADRSGIDLNDISDLKSSSCLLPSALPMNKSDAEKASAEEKDQGDTTRRHLSTAAASCLSDKGLKNELNDVLARTDAAFQEVTKSGVGDKSSRDLRRRPYPPDRKPNRGGQGRPSQVRGRHHQHHEGPRLDLLPDNFQAYTPSGLSGYERFDDIDSGLPPKEKRWSSKIGMIFQYQRQVMSTRFQHATSHSPESRSTAYIAQAPVSGLGLNITSAAMAAPSRPESEEGRRSLRTESAPARDSFRSPPSPLWHQGSDLMASSTRTHPQQDEANYPDMGYGNHAESRGNPDLIPFPSLPVSRTRSLQYDGTFSNQHNAKFSLYASDHSSTRGSAKLPHRNENLSQPDQPEGHYGSLWEQRIVDDKNTLEGSGFGFSRFDGREQLSFDPLNPYSQFVRQPESPNRRQQQPREGYSVQDRERVFVPPLPPPPPLHMLRSMPLPPPLPLFQRSGDSAVLENLQPENHSPWSPSREPVSPSPAVTTMSSRHRFEQGHSEQHRHPQPLPLGLPNRHPFPTQEHEKYDTRDRSQPPQGWRHQYQQQQQQQHQPQQPSPQP
ncbi:hypothetical protein EMPS_06309 [Entomortierella parvispora]|uniref:Zn(2)-C6 fungal-type domain-containing protein n=1 Tax=Entomortierella parvispora TaxID=205924 RepID=A0A9P3HCA5_9FUNG|nr:hypothetical protein EMPS_06309 [Entomortierella parvispora]